MPEPSTSLTEPTGARWTGPPRASHPSAVVAMGGAGQLAQMTHQDAISLGLELRVLAGSEAEGAVAAGARALVGENNLENLRALAAGAAVLTFDHEGFDGDSLRRLRDEGVRIAPSPEALLFGQDKLFARQTLAARGYPFPAFATADTIEEVDSFATEQGWPLVAKTPRGGYDGRGVFVLDDRAAAADLIAKGPGTLILEPALQIRHEIAVLTARRPSGEVAIYPAVETIQVDAICHEILAPAPLDAALCAEAVAIARDLVVEIDATGTVAVEFFVTDQGILINELALRPHNSGHWTIEGAVTSQFEQHLRAVMDWPLGSTDLRAPAVATANILGPADGSDPRERVAGLLGDPGLHLHLYGKDARPGRKLGHLTALASDLDTARAQTRNALALIEGGAS